MNRRQKATLLYKPLLPLIKRLQHRGATLEEIAEELNTRGHRTINGGLLHKVAVHRIIRRFDDCETMTSARPTWRKGLTRAERQQKSFEFDQRIIYWSTMGWPKAEIAEKLGLSIHSVRRRMKRLVDEGLLEPDDERRNNEGR